MIYHSEPWTTQVVLAFTTRIKDSEIREAIKTGVAANATSTQRAAYFTWGSLLFLNTSSILWMGALIEIVLAALLSFNALLCALSVVGTMVTGSVWMIYLRYHQRQQTNIRGKETTFTSKDLVSSMIIGVIVGGIWGFLFLKFCQTVIILQKNADNAMGLGFIGIALLLLALVAYAIGSSANVDATYPYYRTWKIDKKDAYSWYSGWRKAYFSIFTVWFSYLLLTGKVSNLTVTTVIFWISSVALAVWAIKTIHNKSSLFAPHITSIDFWLCKMPLGSLIIVMAVKLFFFWLPI